MKTWIKVTLSILGVFLGGVTSAYQGNPQGAYVAWIMGGLAPVAGYLVGFYQLNPSLRSKKGR